MAAPALGGRVLAVIFEDAPAARLAVAGSASVEDEPLVSQLEAEVKALREELRADAEEYGSAGEELRAANEEVTSMNEELQSANEELEASKEELQSLNEELRTVSDELRALNDRLEQRVTERTELAEARAEQLRALAAELTLAEQRERENLARILHDDLQQILVAAQIQLGLLRMESLDAASLGYVDRLGKLIQESIRSSRSLTAELSPIVLREEGLGAALSWLALQMKAKFGLDVRTKIKATVPLDKDGVAFLLFQGARELLFNVVKHAHVSEARVELDRIDGDQVRVIVSDDGAGFEPLLFVTGGAVEAGMGLFGVCERVRYVGGSCAIDSAPGRGTRVTLTARMAHDVKQARPVAPAAPLAAPPPARTRRNAKRKIRVLLADDHAIVRQGIGEILSRQRDIEVVAEVSDGHQAIEAARRLRPDVVVTDIIMPEVSGIEATRVIHSELPAIRIIGLAMRSKSEGAKAMLEAGAVAYLTKDGPSEDLLAAIRAGVAR